MNVRFLRISSSLTWIAAAALAVAACTVRETSGDTITVQYDALHPELGQIEADRYCQQMGKSAVLVATKPGSPSLSMLMLNSTVGTFRCVGGAGGAAAAPR